MPLLVEPDVRFHASFLRAMAAFAAEGRGAPDDTSTIGRDLREWGPHWHDPAVFAEYVAEVRALALPETPRPAGHVPSTTMWWAEGDEYLGRIQLRQHLNEFLTEVGGHVGYDVPPEHRRQGHATAMLRALLPLAAKGFGLDRVLVTCDEDNVASRKVIEACGGVFEDQRGVKLRYWVPTS
ncbi:MAG TPA: GNAT family N-acetyltransferase [Pedococcus sp.]|jgi:predicted acetyltransferase|uniref:GNAT family N-acetyltransferase n=1 Tax=Pedococcus sp. TaxID=2860345 RepID=UPI002F9348B6